MSKPVFGPSNSESPVSAFGASATEALSPLLFRFRDLKLISRGQDRLSFRAFDDQLKREVVLKTLTENVRNSEHALKRFRHEAEINARLQHPGIVPIYETGDSSDYGPYLAMRMVAGTSLKRILDDRPSDEDRDAMKLMDKIEKLAQTLAYAHANGVVHCDLNPEAILIGEFGEVQVLSWSSAQLMLDADVMDCWGRDAITTAEEIQAEARFQPRDWRCAAPEQAHGEVRKFGPMTDVFALGAMMFRILSGRSLYEGDAEAAARQARSGAVQEALERLEGCEADPELIKLTKLCLQPDPAARRADAALVARTIAAHREQAQKRLRQAELDRAIAQAKEREERSRRRLTIASAAVGLIMFAGLVVVSVVYIRDWGMRLASAQTLCAEAEAAARLARDDRDCDFRLWQSAQQITERALGQISEDFASQPARDQLEALSRELAQDVARLAKLDVLRLPRIQLEGGRDAALTWAGDCERIELFRELGLDLSVDPAEESFERLEASNLRRGLIWTLDEWAFLTEDRTLRVRLLEAAQKLGVDPAIQVWREAALRGDRAGLIRSAETLIEQLNGNESAPPVTHPAFLASALCHYGHCDLARKTLKAGFRRCSNSLWLNLALAREFDHEVRRPEEPFYGLVTAAPGGVGLSLALVRRFDSGGRDPDEVLCAFTAAAAIRPRFAPLQAIYGKWLQAQGRSDEALAALHEAAQLQPEQALRWFELADISAGQQHYSEAARAYEKGVEAIRGPDSVVMTVERKMRAVHAALASGETELRSKALEWLDNELGTISFLSPDEAKQRLISLKTDPRLAIASPTAIAGWPLSEAEAWNEFWARVDRMLASMGSGNAP